MGTSKKTAMLMLLCALGIALGGGTARADGAPVGSDIQVAQTLGARDLTVIMRRIDVTPGELHVDIATHTGTAPGTLALAAAADGVVFSRGEVTLAATPGLYSGEVAVDHPGPWELRLSDGTTTATIPFVVPAQVVPPWEKAAYGGFVAAGALLLIALAVAVRSRRTAYALVPAGGMVAALAVAITGALLSTGTPPPPAPGAQLDATVDNVTDPYALSRLPVTDYSRPPVNFTVQHQNTERPGLDLHFTDGSTGRPADDLVIHDDALVHLIVVSPSGRLWHLHPVRVAPGTYHVAFTPPEAGTYAVAAELERRGGGVQLARSTVDLTTTGHTTAEIPAGPGKRVINGTPIDITTTPIQAGTPVTITVHFPTGDLQPWLGMLGHLVVVGPLPSDADVGAAAATAPTWAHAHAMPPYVPGLTGVPDETVNAYGPDVPFTYTFATPGRYRLWLQAERGWSVLTVPVALDVPAAPGGGS
ncbi:hypothetical protein VSH64_39660 [Amycolatopsis rhabdoformis]|uniref:Secreted protein n=1 Tax=Amycolatopsis rhabdoformis TaxID=1448059 RepID=A0ABZ1I3X5_9PSEU|nr:hypothetical protein [Amycolatopsis rhabdoformis]WSE28884.1 hypothetical protein VSH64_39660 [Amycolatopsis rhabdoformis]